MSRESESPLNVVHVCSASRAVYGAVQSLLTLAAAQQRAGDSVQFITFKGKVFGAEVRDMGFSIQEARVRLKVDPIAILQMRKMIMESNFDIVHTHLSTSSVIGCLAARLARTPCVATVHGMSGRLSFAAANHLIAVSDEVKRHLVSQGAEASAISVVFNGLPINFKQGDRDKVRRELGFGPESVVLGTVSRVTPLKGIEDAIRAFSSLYPEFSDLRYLVVGDGVGLEACRRLATELGVAESISFVGYQSDIGKYLAAMDIFVFPTHKEAMGIALVEAMAAGLPCVATRTGGIPEVVSSETGVLVSVGSPSELADSVKKLILDPKTRASMSQCARTKVESTFSTESMRSGTDQVYRDVIRAYRSR